MTEYLIEKAEGESEEFSVITNIGKIEATQFTVTDLKSDVMYR